MDLKHENGQYMTTNKILQDKVYDFIMNNPIKILEPSFGMGHLVENILSKSNNIKFDLYEIDSNLDNIFKQSHLKNLKIKYCDFLKKNVNKKYMTIIGNPPYVRTTKGNLYVDFIEKCYGLLEDGGELIFIIPSDFFKLTCSKNIINEMMDNGNFTHIYHPNNEKLFLGASVDIVVFRYCKNNLPDRKIMYNDKQLYVTNSDGLITFDDLPLKENDVKL